MGFLYELVTSHVSSCFYAGFIYSITPVCVTKKKWAVEFLFRVPLHKFQVFWSRNTGAPPKGVHSDTDVFVLLQKTRHIGRSGEDKRRLRKRKRASPACVRLNTHQKKNFVGQAGIILLMQSRGGGMYLPLRLSLRSALDTHRYIVQARPYIIIPFAI